MSYQYHDQGGYGIPNFPGDPPRQRHMPPPQGRRPPLGFAPGYGAPDLQRGPPPMRPHPHGAPSGRFPVRPQQQQYQRPSTEHLYDGSAYGEIEDESYDQWPLPSRPFVQHGRSGSPGSNSKQPPLRPQRPDYEHPVPDPPRPPAARVAPAAQHYRPPPTSEQFHHGSGQWTGEGYTSPATTVQPQGPRRVPDYLPPLLPPQGAYGQANKRPPLGPPPSARRGPASYYPQIGPVHPIVEETDSAKSSARNHDSMKSFATSSSNAIPIGIPDYYLEHRDSVPSIPETVPGPDSEYDESLVDRSIDGRQSRLYERDPEPSPEPASIVRQASLGKKTKPTLTTVKNGERMLRDGAGDGLSTLPSQQRGIPSATQVPPPTVRGAALVQDLSMRSDSEPESYQSARREIHDSEKDVGSGADMPIATRATFNKSTEALSQRMASSDVLSSGTGLLDPSSSESEKEIRRKPSKELLGAGLANGLSKTTLPRARGRSPLAREVDPRVDTVLRGQEKGGAFNTKESEKLKTPTAGLSERAGKRRPPRLNFDAVRDTEARDSMTSLPDLIRRATRLASNLDRGKTASRLGVNLFDVTDSDEKNQSSDSNNRRSGSVSEVFAAFPNNRRSGSISEVFAAFPPPALGTPPALGGEMRRSYTNWSSTLRHSALPSDSDIVAIQDRKRKCCGMPLWLFLLVLVILVLLVAAAIIVPVMLIVVPKENGRSSSASVPSCSGKLNCQNGGASVLSNDGSCKCLCVNGYTGTTCTTNSQAGCTTISVGSTNGATVGNAIPRLLSSAEANFSVPLDGQTLLGLFNGAGLSCNTENALVTFNNNEERSLRVEILFPTPTVEKRTSGNGAVTSDGIVYQTGSPSGSSTPSSTTSSSALGSSSPSSSSGLTADTNSTTAMDFARVAVLYIFQASGQLSSATTAQTDLQSYFISGQTSTGQTINPANLSLGNGFTCNLGQRSINLANGTMIGAASAD